MFVVKVWLYCCVYLLLGSVDGGDYCCKFVVVLCGVGMGDVVGVVVGIGVGID